MFSCFPTHLLFSHYLCICCYCYSSQIVAVILCDTGIALLAYMDGITESRTLSGVVLATLAAACYAVFRVC